jgi:hypothetical protein
MIVRGLDKNHDWTFGNGKQDYRVDQLCVEQNCKTRLMSFVNDCFFDVNAGIDWWNLLSRGTEEQLLTAIKGVILNTDGVVGINNVEISLVDRVLTVKYDIKTQFSASYQAELNLTITA